MTDEQINEQDEQQPATEEPARLVYPNGSEIAVGGETRLTGGEPPPEAMIEVAADADGWHTEIVLEAQRYVMKVTAPDGSIHICHSQEELEKLKAERGK